MSGSGEIRPGRWRRALRSLLPAALTVLGLLLLQCNLSNQDPVNLVSIEVDSSLAKFDKVRVDILYADGQVYLDSVFNGKYIPNPENQIKDLNLGRDPPANYQIRITAFRDTTAALVISIKQGPRGFTPPVVDFELPPPVEPPKDTTPKPPDSVHTGETLPTKVVINTPSPLTLAANGQATAILAQVQPSGSNQTLLWSSNDSDIVRIDSAGKANPGKPGEAEVTARSKRDPALTAVIRIKVVDTVAVKALVLTPTSTNLYMGGGTVKLDARPEPADAGVSVIFKSSDESIAKASGDGTLSAVKPGKASIEAYPAGYPALAKICSVTVILDPPRLDVGGDRNAKPGEKITFPIVVTQDYGDVAALKWSLDGDTVWDESTTVPTASPQRTYDGKDSVVNVYFHARDTEGNRVTVGRVVRVSRRIVLAAPQFASGTTASPTRIVRPIWAWTGSAQGSGTFRYALDGKAAVESKAKSFTADSLADGDHSLALWELDSLGALSDSAVRVIQIVTKGPIVTITAPVKGFLTNAATVAVAWTVKPLTGALVTNTNSENLGGKQGAIKIRRVESDAYGNTGADSVVIYRDTIAPALPTFTSQTSPKTVNAAYTSPVQWIWTRSAPTDSFLVTLNGVTTRQGAASYVLANPINQNYILSVKALDTAGNASDAATYSILVDRIAPPAPVVSGTTPTGTAAWTWASASGSDGARLYRYKLSTAATYSAEGAGTTYSATNLGTGKYTLRVQERDAAGNWSGDGSWEIEVDKKGPTVTIGKPTPMGRVTSVNPVVSGTVADDHTVKKVEYRINQGSYIPLIVTGGVWSFSENYDVDTNTVWVRGEDQFGNRDSVQIKIYKYPNVVFVRKNATGTGKSWEDALGELYQALDLNKTYPVGTNIWVTKGNYAASPQNPSSLDILHSDIKILGGFYDDKPSIDSSKRDLSLGVSKISAVFFMGDPDRIVHDFVFDGFTIGNRFWLANGDHYRITFRNLKFDQISSPDNILLTRGYVNFVNCDFTNLYSSGDVAIYLKGLISFDGCRFQNVKSAFGNYAMTFDSELKIRNSYFENNGGLEGSYHFYLNYSGQLLDIDGSKIQNGKAGILVDPNFPLERFIYGNANTSF